MSRMRHCRLCGRKLKDSVELDDNNWSHNYCSKLCMEIDSTLPVPECTAKLFGVSSRIMKIRYYLVVSGDSDPVYKEKFEEEEDSMMRTGL